MHFLTTRIKSLKKIFFLRLEWLKTCFDEFAHTSKPPESWPEKKYFFRSEKVKKVFWCICAYFQTTRIKFLKRYFLMYGGVKNVLWCICAYFQTTRNMGSNWCYITSVVVMYVFWCICAYFQTTRIKFFLKIFFNVWSGKKRA